MCRCLTTQRGPQQTAPLTERTSLAPPDTAAVIDRDDWVSSVSRPVERGRTPAPPGMRTTLGPEHRTPIPTADRPAGRLRAPLKVGRRPVF